MTVKRPQKTGIKAMVRKEENIPALLAPILENLKKEGLDLDQEGSFPPLSEAWHEATLLNNSWDDLTQAARLLEKIQLAVTSAERSALISHDPRARKSLQITLQISEAARKLFHQMKEKKDSKKAA